MAYRRRRKSKGIWFPLITTEERAGFGGNDCYGVGQSSVITFTGQSPITTAIFPLVPDNAGFVQPTNSLSELSDDITQYGWMCKRILGHWFVGVEQSENDTWKNLQIDAGVLVADADPQAQNAPAGGNPTAVASADALQFATTLDYSPGAVATIARPWMFRRTWFLANRTAGTAVASVESMNFDLPANNTFLGTQKEGTWVDIKSRRHVKPRERLFAAISVQPIWTDGPSQDGGPQNVTILTKLVLRAFGTLTRPRLGGTF